MRFRHGQVGGSKAKERMAKRIDLFTIAKCDGARCGKTIVSPRKLHRNGITPEKRGFIGFLHRSDRGVSSGGRNRQQSSLQQLI